MLKRPLSTSSPSSVEIESLKTQLVRLRQLFDHATRANARSNGPAAPFSEAHGTENSLLTEVRTIVETMQRTVDDLEHALRKRERTEEALRESEQQFQFLYDNNPSMYFILSPDGIVLSVNTYGAEQLGYRRDELVRKSVLTVFESGDHETIHRQLKTCSSHPGDTFEWEIRKVRKNGSRLWVHERARAAVDPHRGLVIMVVCENVTEHRHTTQLLSTLVRESPLPLVSLDENARITTWNQAATRLFGWTEEEVLGRELPYIPNGEEAAASVLWEQGLLGDITGPIELRRCRKDGSILDLLLWPVFVPAESGRSSTAVGLYVDQSDLKRAEAAQVKSEARLRSFLDALDDLAFEFDETGTYLNVWTKNEAMLALPRRDIIGKALTDVFGVEQGGAHLEVIRQVLDTGETRAIEYDLAISGYRHYFSAVLSRIPAAGLVKATVACVVRDITARKEVEEALRTSEERFSKAFRMSPHPIIVTELDTGRCVEINEASLRLFGYRRDEVVGQTTLNLGLWPTLSSRADFLKRLVAAGSLRNQEMDFYTKERSLRRCLVSSELIELNGVKCVVTVGSDITEQKRAEEALRVSEARLQRFVEEAPVGLVILDNKQRLLSANRAFCDLTGYPESEVVGHSYHLYIHPDDLPKNVALTDELYHGMRSEYALEKRYIKKTGETIWVSVRATGVDMPNHPGPLLLAVVQDITERKQASESRERLSQDLHDNILQSLYAVGMQLEAGKLVAGQSIRRSKTYMTQAIDQLNQLVTDVRTFIALLKQGPSPSMNFRQALRQIVDSFSSNDRKAADLAVEDRVIEAISPVQAEQLLNIAREALSNSVRHGQAANRQVSLRRESNSVVMQISDDGIGFDPKRKRIHGHGLMNIAARAKNIRARLVLESAPGRGTCITVELPGVE
ncbi:hypothetical protein W02_28700 [Nitrospira sp. KM1]|uniref:PAS domain-containing sensor histidine kinase n=1 Tax=Nitrospira sp. KM1 TaxID=1936990 RepID=UPI0013A765CD|nr:PAS domain S-box protein [Nitrospira sp. KM1]BCA55730.1 hypothetical protein W02_28700 [Nitrospira sp. KM1]